MTRITARLWTRSSKTVNLALHLLCALILALSSQDTLCQLSHEVIDTPPKTVFFVHYRHSSFNSSEDIRTGFVEGMTKLGVRVSVQADHIRFGLDKISDDQNIVEAALLNSIQAWEPNLIVVHGLKSANAFLGFNSEKFAQWPILFTATPRLPPGLREAYPNSTAMLDKFPIKENLELAKALHPKADRIIFIGTSNKSENAYRFDMARELIKKHQGKPKLETMFDKPANALYRDIGDAPTKDVIIDLKDYIDESGSKVFVDTFMSTMQSKKKPVPIYSFWRPTRDYKITGGYFFNEKSKGRNIAGVAARILREGYAGNIPIDSANNSQPMFFWSELDRHNIPISKLPENSIIFNRPHLLTGAQWKILGGSSIFIAILIIFIIYLLSSIKKLRVADIKVRAARDEAERANKVKSRFLANMSHEIRTPMNAILGFSDILLRKKLQPDYKEYISAISTSGRTLMSLINDILDLSKIESGKIQLQKHKVESAAIFKETESIFRLSAEKKGLEFTLLWDDAIPKHLILDEIRMRQVLFNLVGNAIKFTDSGFVKVAAYCARLNKENNNVSLTIEISDSGIGIGNNDLENIFEEFVQQEGQDSRIFGGTGLGLTISKRLVELMGGRISVQSTLGEGTVFTLSINDIQLPDDISINEMRSDSRPTSNAFNGENVLIAEDNKLNQLLFQEMGKELNLKFELVENGKIAIDKIHAHPPALAIFDIEMPVMDGITAIKSLRSSSETSELPILIVSATDRDDTAELVKRFNLLGFARKPVTKDQMCMYLNQVLQQSAQPQKIDKPIVDDSKQAPTQKLSAEQLAHFEKLNTDQLATAASCRDVDFIASHIQQIKELQQTLGVNVMDQYIEKYQSACTNFDISTLDKAQQEYTDELGAVAQDT